MHVKLGDKVVVRTGKDSGLDGEVIAVDMKRGRVKVERRNMITKHRKPNPLTGADGARVEIEGWLDASNVGLYSEAEGGPVRTQKRWVGKGGKLHDSAADARATFGDSPPPHIKKVRYCVKTEEVFDEV